VLNCCEILGQALVASWVKAPQPQSLTGSFNRDGQEREEVSNGDEILNCEEICDQEICDDELSALEGSEKRAWDNLFWQPLGCAFVPIEMGLHRAGPNTEDS
jgi:hypothetical protein